VRRICRDVAARKIDEVEPIEHAETLRTCRLRAVHLMPLQAWAITS
jgi:hypothetical protein